MPTIVPGVLTNDEEDYVFRLKRAQSVAELVQIDVLDGKFAPNVTIGVDVIKKYRSSACLEVQLMVQSPADYIKDLVQVEYVTKILFPLEVAGTGDNIKTVKQAGKEVGLSINPETAVRQVSDFNKDLDVICIFSASPGFSGKKLEEAVYGRIAESKKLFPSLPIEIDIGVNLETAPKLAKAGADFLVATSALHNAPDYQSAYDELTKRINT